MNIIQKSIDGITPHILRLKKLLAGVLASCWSMMLHLLFFLERVFWQIKRSQLIALIGQGYTMLESVVRQSRRIVRELLSTSHLEDTTGTSFYDSAERQGSDHSGSTKPSSTLTQGETENGVLGTNRLGIDAETENELAIANAETAASLREASYAHDSSLGNPHRWVVDTLRMVRPVLTLFLLTLVGGIYFTTDDFAMKAGVIESVLFMASSAVTWWFGDRSLKGRK
jgi:hypothetical protein